MHCIPSKSLNINPMIVENVSIIPIIMKTLLVVCIFHIFLKFHYCVLSISIVVNKQSGTISKIYIRPHKDLGTNYFSVPNRTLFFCVDIYCLCIPCMYPIRNWFENFYHPLCFFSWSHNSGPFNLQIFHCFVHPQLSHSLKRFLLFLNYRGIKLFLGLFLRFFYFHTFLRFYRCDRGPSPFLLIPTVCCILFYTLLYFFRGFSSTRWLPSLRGHNISTYLFFKQLYIVIRGLLGLWRKEIGLGLGEINWRSE